MSYEPLAPHGLHMICNVVPTGFLDEHNLLSTLASESVLAMSKNLIPKSWRNSMSSSRSWVVSFTSTCRWTMFLDLIFYMHDRNLVSFPPKMDIQLTQNQLLKRQTLSTALQCCIFIINHMPIGAFICFGILCFT